jgi:hypothetical protein
MNRRLFLYQIAGSMEFGSPGTSARPFPTANSFSVKFEDLAPHAGLTTPTIFDWRFLCKQLLSRLYNPLSWLSAP